MDNLTRKNRSWNMSRICSTDTVAEQTVRSYLYKRGLRFHNNDITLPGKPDIVFPKLKAILFINGCYWHRHKGCKRTTMPKSNTTYWRNKFKMNKRRDQRNARNLRLMGYRVLTIWECQTKINSKLVSLFNRIRLTPTK